MLEVVFSDSVKGAIRQAKRNKGILLGSTTNYSCCRMEHTDSMASNYEEAIDGSPEDVVNIGVALDVGDISGAIDSKERKKVFQSVMTFGNVDKCETKQFFTMQNISLTKLIKAAKQGIPIRIWKSYAPYSACGYAYVCDVLKDIDCKISVVSLPNYQLNADTIISYEHWGEVPPNKFHSFLTLEKELSYEEKTLHANLWQNLRKENSPLRANVNGRLISVREEFYDHLIIKNIPNHQFDMAQLVGHLLGNYQLGVSGGWYVMRIKNLIDMKQLEVVSNSSSINPYRMILRKIA